MDNQTIINEMAANSADYLLADGRLDVLALATDAEMMLAVVLSPETVELALQAQDLNVARGEITPPHDRANQKENILLALDARNRKRRRETQCGPVQVGDMVFVKHLNTEYGAVDCYLVCTAVMNQFGRFYGYHNGHGIGEYRWNAADLERLIKTEHLSLCSLH